MSHLNILKISREIDNINKNILNVQTEVSSIQTDNETINRNIKDLNEIKSNKVDILLALEQIKEDFKFLETKVNLVDKNIKHIVNRNIDYVNKNNEKFSEFLKTEVKLDQKKINIILYIFDCYTVQQVVLIDDRELLNFGFNQQEINLLMNKCRENLEQSYI